MLGKRIDGKLVTSPPKAARLSTGQWVSHYDLLPEETLIAEGWKELTEVKPELGEGQHWEQDGIEETNTTITVTYAAVDDPEDLPSFEALLGQANETIAVLDAAVVDLTYQNILLEMGV